LYNTSNSSRGKHHVNVATTHPAAVKPPHPAAAQEQTPDQSHLGRDAALGGTVGAAGLAAHHSQQHQAASYQPQPQQFQQTDPVAEKHHHLGRDAALGAGAAGVAAHEHSKASEHEKHQETETASSPTHKKSILKKIFGSGDKTDVKREDEQVATNPEHEHHLGRDAALGTGAMGAAGLAEEHHRRNEAARQHPGGVHPATTQSKAYHSPQRTHQGALPVVLPVDQREHRYHGEPHDERNERTHHYNKLQKKQPPGNVLTSDSSNAKQHKEHHLGRDAAIGAGAIGLAEHEHHKHEKQHEDAADEGESPTRKKSILKRIFGSGDKDDGHHHEGTSAADVRAPVAEYEDIKLHPHQQNTVAGDAVNAPNPSAQEQHPHHYGRDAAVAAGLGTAGLAGYEHRKHHQNNAVPAQPVDTAQAQQVQQPVGQPGAKPLHQSNVAPTQYENHPTQTQQHHHHASRDVALGGGAGAAGLAAYEHHKYHENGTAPTQPTYPIPSQHIQHPAELYNHTQAPTQSVQPATANRVTGSAAHGQGGRHLGRDAALSAGAVGLAEHEHRKHEHERDVAAGDATAVPPRKEHSVLDQIFNPHSKKANATAIPPLAPGEKPALDGIPADQKIYTDPNAKKENNILKQIFHPNDQINPVALGTTASTQEPPRSTVLPAAEKETGLKRQILNRKCYF
jgi:hypothetical protein